MLKLTALIVAGLAGLGFALFAFGAGPSTGTNTAVATACASVPTRTVTAASHALSRDGQPLATEPGDTITVAGADHCETVTNIITFAIPTVTTAVTVQSSTVSQSINAGATLSGAPQWTAAATGTPASLHFLIDGVDKWTERSPPYQFNGDPAGVLDTKTLSNGTHTFAVVAYDAAANEQGRVSASATVQNLSASRVVYCLGDPSYGTAGFKSDGTSSGWLRQFPLGSPGRLYFDNSVSVMQSLGCTPLAAELQPADTNTAGAINDVQRAQVYSSDSLTAQYAGLPGFDFQPGNERWYSFAFRTNPGFVPQPSPDFGDGIRGWNTVLTFHACGTCGVGIQQPYQVEINTTYAGAGNIKCGQGVRQNFPDGNAHLTLSVDAGNSVGWPASAGSVCLRYPGPAFVAGQLYRVAYHVKWANDGTGFFEWFVDGVKYASVSNVDTLFYPNPSIFPVFENYRKYDTTRPVNIIYYGGLVKGLTAADVQIP